MSVRSTSELRAMSIQDLKVLRKRITNIIEAKAKDVLIDLAIGDSVMVDHKKLSGEVCKVVKINRTKAIVDSISMGKVSVPSSLLVAI
jgi:hypothetical protein